MTFEEKIINNCQIRQKKLMRPARIAQGKPDTGVTIVKKGAYFLIKLFFFLQTIFQQNQFLLDLHL